MIIRIKAMALYGLLKVQDTGMGFHKSAHLSFIVSFLPKMA